METLSDRCSSSQPTVSRRLDEPQQYDPLAERTECDTDWNHYKAYECRLEQACVDVDDGSFTVDLQLRRGVLDDADGDDVADARRAGVRPCCVPVWDVRSR